MTIIVLNLMGTENSFISNVRLKAEASVGHHGRVIACYLDNAAMLIIGVCSTRVEAFNAFTGERTNIYNSAEDTISSYYDRKKQLLVLGQSKGNIQILTSYNLKVIIEMAINKSKICPAVSSIYEIDNTVVAGYSNGLTKKFNFEGKELVLYSPIMNKKSEVMQNIKENVLPFLNYSSIFAPVRHIKVSHKHCIALIAYYSHFRNEENQVVRLLDNNLALFKYDNGKIIGEIVTSGNAILCLELIERKSYCVTLEGEQNNVYIYDYSGLHPLLKFSLSSSGFLGNNLAISLQVIENTEALLLANRAIQQIEEIGDFFIIGFDNGMILSSTYKIHMGDQHKIKMEWLPQYLYKNNQKIEKLDKNGFNPKDFCICSLFADPKADICLGGDFDGNITVSRKIFSSIIEKGLNRIQPGSNIPPPIAEFSFLKKMKEGIPMLLSRIGYKFQSFIVKRPNNETIIEMEGKLETENKQEESTEREDFKQPYINENALESTQKEKELDTKKEENAKNEVV